MQMFIFTPTNINFAHLLKANKHSILKLTHTGVLFPFFTPFTVTDSTLNNKLPQQQTNLPFHVTTWNPIKIAFQQHPYFRQI